MRNKIVVRYFMKKIILLIFLLTLQLFSQNRNLIFNPGFEEYTNGWNITGNVELSTYTARVFNGKYSGRMYMETSELGKTYIYQTVTVEPSTIYTAGGYFYDSDYDKEIGFGYISIVWLENGQVISTHTSVYTVNTSEWQHITTGRIISPESANQAKICIGIEKVDNTTSKSIYIDDLYFIKLGKCEIWDKTKNFPNPFNPRPPNNEKTKIVIPEEIFSENFEIRIYSLSGDLVNITHTSEWDGRDKYGDIVDAGIYFYVIKTDKGVAKGKLIVVK